MSISSNEVQLLRLPEVLSLIPIKKSTFWMWVKMGKMPKPIKLSQRVSVWDKKELLRSISVLAEMGYKK